MSSQRRRLGSTMVDPVFGLPVMKDSKAMDFARFRNSSQDKRLQSHIDDLDTKCRALTTKHMVAKASTREFLDTLNHDQEKPIVCPPGLSWNQKDKYRRIRRGSAPTMSLNEFDQKLLEARRQRLQYSHRSDVFDNGSLIAGATSASPFSTPAQTKTRIVYPTDGASKSTVLPLYKCKSAVKETLQRLSSVPDSKMFAAADKPRSSRANRHSDSDLFVDGPVSTSGFSFRGPSLGEGGKGVHRRNTLPDLKLDSPRSVAQHLSKFVPISDIENKAFDRFIKKIKVKNDNK